MTKHPIFVTGNQDKADYLARTLGMELEHHKLDLDEIQSPDPQVVIEHKVKQAYDILKQPVLVEDTSLSFNALGGLPGTFIKFFVSSEDGLEHLCRMLDGFEDRSAYASAVYGYFDGETLTFFSGRLNGIITDHPRGTGGYGWDPIFEPVGYDGHTRAELSAGDDIETYNKIRDFDSLKTFLSSD
jgi:non-canonical purine NTP pyrophosphatase (RdgB/HAM1 family)